MDFLDYFSSVILKEFENQKIRQERVVRMKGVFATKEDKEKLKRITDIYNQKLEWYERMIELEISEI